MVGFVSPEGFKKNTEYILFLRSICFGGRLLAENGGRLCLSKEKLNYRFLSFIVPVPISPGLFQVRVEILWELILSFPVAHQQK